MHWPEFFAMAWYTPVPTERLPLPIMTVVSLTETGRDHVIDRLVRQRRAAGLIPYGREPLTTPE